MILDPTPAGRCGVAALSCPESLSAKPWTSLTALVIGDGHDAVERFARPLEARRWKVERAEEVSLGVSRAEDGAHHVLLLDLEAGRDRCMDATREIRARGVTAPLLMLSECGDTEDVVSGLDAGADDYLSEPFEEVELLARLRALVRRSGVLRFADIELDQIQDDVRRGGLSVSLTPIEFKLLRVMMLRPDRAWSRAELLQRVWGIDFDPRTPMIDVHVSRLRKKLEAKGRSRVIGAVRGVGFTMRFG